MKLRKAHGAQPSKVTDEEIVKSCRSSSANALGSRVFILQGALGFSFDFDTLGSILSRATDAELVALHRGKRR